MHEYQSVVVLELYWDVFSNVVKVHVGVVGAAPSQTTLTDILHALVSHDFGILLDQQVAKDIGFCGC